MHTKETAMVTPIETSLIFKLKRLLFRQFFFLNDPFWNPYDGVHDEGTGFVSILRILRIIPIKIMELEISVCTPSSLERSI